MAKVCGITFNSVQEVCKLKEQTICDFQDLLFKATKGRYFDYEQILQKISLIDIAENMGNIDRLDYYVTYYNSIQWVTAIKQY